MFISSAKTETKILKYRRKKQFKWFLLHVFSFFSHWRKKLEFFSINISINNLQSEIEKSLMFKQIKLMMKFMQTIMSCSKKTISNESENLKTAMMWNLSENLHKKISIFLMYLFVTIFNFVWFFVSFRISSVMIWIHNNLKRKTEKIYYCQL